MDWLNPKNEREWMELFRMFNINLVDAGVMEKSKEKGTNVFLWKFKKRRQSRKGTRIVFYKDNIKPGVTEQKRGPKRVEDLKRFYEIKKGETPFKEN